MPNWCENELTITHAEPAMVKKAKKAWKSRKFLNAFIPIPKELNIVAGFSGDEVEQAEREKIYAANTQKFGHPHWWEFCTNEWGTKWDIGYDKSEHDDFFCNEFEDGFNVSFNSAWSPPIKAYKKLVAMGFNIEAHYYEPGCDFCGSFIDGVIQQYECKTAPLDLQERFAMDFENLEE